MALSTLKRKTQVENVPEGASSAEEESDVASSDGEAAEGNEGWADSIAKVLSTTKPKSKKTLVLSRAKKYTASEKVKKIKSAKEAFGFEVAEGVDKQAAEDEDEEKKPTKVKEEVDVKPKNLKLPIRIKPSIADIERERTFKKIATRGVVQLFNAVRVQQKDIDHQLQEAGRLDSKRDAVLNNIDKKKFLDVLMSGTRARSEHVDGKVKKEEESSSAGSSSEDEASEGEDGSKKKKKWSVLESDFLTNKKAKHWDEEEDEENGMHSSGQDDSAEDDE